jgi:hypothetical protein
VAGLPARAWHSASFRASRGESGLLIERQAMCWSGRTSSAPRSSISRDLSHSPIVVVLVDVRRAIGSIVWNRHGELSRFLGRMLSSGYVPRPARPTAGSPIHTACSAPRGRVRRTLDSVGRDVFVGLPQQRK